MKNYLAVALSAAFFVPVSLSAQSKLEDNLKAVMVLFDKSRKESEARIQELTKENGELRESNLGLKGRLEALEKENMLLRSKISEVAVNELETAALTSNAGQPAEMGTPGKQPPDDLANPDQQPIPDFTPNAFKKTGNKPVGAEHLSEGTVLLVNLNTATERELRLIPGVGPQMAKRIADGRPYASIWDLMKLQGMGKKRIETLQVYITLE